jgi:hypothetical protein
VASVKHVADIMGEITAASEEQSSGIEEVNRAITQMDEMTQQNAALVEQAAAAADSMQLQAGALAQAIAVFKLEAMPQSVVPAQVAQVSTPTIRPLVKQQPAVSLASKPSSGAAVATRAKVRPVPAPSSGDDWEEF